MSMRTDLIVIGGGPAGTATALAATRAGLGVLLLERSRGPIRKVCGEFLSGPGVAAVERLGVTIPPAPPITRARFQRGGRSVSFPLEPAGVGLRREWLDRELLLAAASTGVRIVRGATRVSWRRDGDWEVTWKESARGSAVAAQAPRLVMATGRAVAATADAWVGYRVLSRSPDPVDEVDEEALRLRVDGPDHYFGRAPVDDGSVTETHLVRRSRVEREVRHLSLSGAIDLATPPFRLGVAPHSDAEALYPVGDAMAAWPPLVGDGMTAALLSGERLGALLGEPGLTSARWRRAWEEEFGGRLRRSLRLHRAICSGIGSAGLWALGTAVPSLASRLGRSVRLTG
jgi:flavin-dependent dehydrogenase